MQVSLGGTPTENPQTVPDYDGQMGIRIFEPCLDPDGIGCTLFEDPDTLHLAESRWYPSSARIFDGSLVGKLATGLEVPSCVVDGRWRQPCPHVFQR